jgi:hypothetical protein
MGSLHACQVGGCGEKAYQKAMNNGTEETDVLEN